MPIFIDILENKVLGPPYKKGLEEGKQAFVFRIAGLAVGPARVTGLEGKQALVVQVCPHARQQRLLIGARQKGLKCIAG